MSSSPATTQVEAPEAFAMSVEQFADKFAVSLSYAYKLVARGEVRARKMGSRNIILMDDAKAWAASLPEWTSPSKGKPVAA